MLKRRNTKGKPEGGTGLGGREIREERTKTKKDATGRKITSVYRDLDKKEQQRGVM